MCQNDTLSEVGKCVFFSISASPRGEGKCNNNYMKLGGDKLVDGTYFYYLKLNDIIPEFSWFVELKRN